MISDAEHAAATLGEARRVLALTGAGISVESGIPDFRSPGGLWSVFAPDEYATLSVFREDPGKAWVFYRALARTLHGTLPNPAHLAVAELEQHGLVHGVITQNIDGLHQEAGSRRVLELHGDARWLRCLSCDRRTPMVEDHLDEDASPPICPRCRVPLKPDLVLFQEPVHALDEAMAWLAGCDLMLVIGTSAQVHPAAGLPAAVLAAGGSLLEFNLERTRLTAGGLGPRGRLIHGPAGRTLPAVLAHLGV